MKIYKTKLFVLLTMLLIYLLIPSCSLKSKDIDISSCNIVFITKAKTNTKADSYWDVVRMGANAAAAEYNANLELLAPDTEQDTQQQIQLVEQSLNKKIDALVLAANNYTGLNPYIEKAYNRNIPVILIDSEVSTNKFNSFIGTDNYKAGISMGKLLTSYCGKDASVSILGLTNNPGNEREREKGLMNYLSFYPSIKILANENTVSSTQDAEILTRRIAVMNPKSDAIIALNSAATEGAANALKELNLKDKIKIFAFDSTEDEIELLENGYVKATIVENPFVIGYLGVKNAVKALKGETIPNKFYTEATVINKENMYDPKNEKLLFPFVQ